MSTLSSRVGAMFTAASEMISASAWVGTSNTKQWLMRRAVRSPVSFFTTSAISSSVWRLPFISASALPARTSATACAAAAWLWGASTTSYGEMSSLNWLATPAIFAFGPTRIGLIGPICAAWTAPESALSSQGCATAVASGGSAVAASMSRRYFSCGAFMGPRLSCSWHVRPRRSCQSAPYRPRLLGWREITRAAVCSRGIELPVRWRHVRTGCVRFCQRWRRLSGARG